MMETLFEGQFQIIKYIVIQATAPFQQNIEQLTEMTESTLGHHLPLSLHFSIKARSHAASFKTATTLIAAPITAVATIDTITAAL